MSQSMLASRSGQYWIHFLFKNIMHILHFFFKYKRLIQFVSKFCHKNCLKYWKKQFSTKSLEAFTWVSSTRFVNMTICATFACHTITQKSLTVFCFGPVYEIMIKLFFYHWGIRLVSLIRQNMTWDVCFRNILPWVAM